MVEIEKIITDFGKDVFKFNIKDFLDKTEEDFKKDENFNILGKYVKILNFFSLEYPESLRKLYDPPYILYTLREFRTFKE